MAYNRSPLSFDDIREAFERAINSPKGISIECKDRGAAVVLRSRFNYLRTLDRQENMKTYTAEHPMWNRSVYDRFVLSIPPKGDPQEHVLFIRPRSAEDLDIKEL